MIVELLRGRADKELMVGLLKDLYKTRLILGTPYNKRRNGGGMGRRSRGGRSNKEEGDGEKIDGRGTRGDMQTWRRKRRVRW